MKTTNRHRQQQAGQPRRDELVEKARLVVADKRLLAALAREMYDEDAAGLVTLVVGIDMINARGGIGDADWQLAADRYAADPAGVLVDALSGPGGRDMVELDDALDVVLASRVN